MKAWPMVIAGVIALAVYIILKAWDDHLPPDDEEENNYGGSV